VVACQRRSTKDLLGVKEAWRKSDKNKKWARNPRRRCRKKRINVTIKVKKGTLRRKSGRR